MERLSKWYDQYIAIRIPDDERVFKTQITWVHDLPPDYVWYDNHKFVSHITPELKYISVVFIHGRLPDYFRTSITHTLALNANTGEWFYHQGNVNVPILVEIVAKG